MDFRPKLLNIDEHRVGHVHHFSVPRQGPVTDLILGCDLSILSMRDVFMIQRSFDMAFEECPAENDFQFFRFPEGTPLADSIALLLAHRYEPACLPDLFGWEFYYSRFSRHVLRDMPMPYPAFPPGSPTRPIEGIQYIPFISDRGAGRHAFGLDLYRPRLPFAPDAPDYYLLARCPPNVQESFSPELSSF